jgi:formate dehydrogenase subunit delta
MSTATQVRLANDIAAQFAYLEHDKAVAGIVAHITSFWDPRMRSQLLDAVTSGAAGLDPLVRDAVEQLR